VPGDGFVPGAGLQALEFVAAVQHSRFEERRRPVSKADVNPGEQRKDQQMPDLRSRDLAVSSGKVPPAFPAPLGLDLSQARMLTITSVASVTGGDTIDSTAAGYRFKETDARARLSTPE
jgi:hypothetical protein